MENFEKRERETVILKRATPEDLGDFIDLEKSVDGSVIYSAMTDKEEALKEINSNMVYIIKRGGEIVGNVSYEMKSPSHAYVSGLVVNPRFQGEGVGREALTAVLKELKEVNKIDLVVHPDNLKAIALYESLGFKFQSRKENYYGDGEPRLVFSIEKK